jgi:mRNA interferase MazF
LKRGDVVIALVRGDYGKPRPVVVVQNDRFAGHTSVTVALITSTLTELDDVRLTLAPTPENGLRATSQVQLDRLQSIPRSRLRDVIGHLTPAQMTRINRGLALFLGLA